MLHNSELHEDKHMQRNTIICNFKGLTWRTKLAERRFSPAYRRWWTQVAHVAVIVPQLFRTSHTSCWFHCFQSFQKSLNIEEKCHKERQRMNKMLQNSHKLIFIWAPKSPKIFSSTQQEFLHWWLAYATLLFSSFLSVMTQTVTVSCTSSVLRGVHL